MDRPPRPDLRNIVKLDLSADRWLWGERGMERGEESNAIWRGVEIGAVDSSFNSAGGDKSPTTTTITLSARLVHCFKWEINYFLRRGWTRLAPFHSFLTKSGTAQHSQSFDSFDACWWWWWWVRARAVTRRAGRQADRQASKRTGWWDSLSRNKAARIRVERGNEANEWYSSTPTSKTSPSSSLRFSSRSTLPNRVESNLVYPSASPTGHASTTDRASQRGREPERERRKNEWIEERERPRPSSFLLPYPLLSVVVIVDVFLDVDCRSCSIDTINRMSSLGRPSPKIDDSFEPPNTEKTETRIYGTNSTARPNPERAQGIMGYMSSIASARDLFRC